MCRVNSLAHVITYEQKLGHSFLYFEFLIHFNFVCTGRIPFAFLEDIHQRFVKTYGRAIHTSPAYAMNDEFSRVLSQQMDYYSNDPNADRLNRLKGEMSQVWFALPTILL